MIPRETIQDYYKSKFPEQGENILPDNREAGSFKVFPRSNYSGNSPFRRRDFYKISFIIGAGNFHYAQSSLTLKRPALLFFNPIIPYSWEATSPVQRGWHCLFTDTFFRSSHISSLQFSQLFQTGDMPVFYPDKKQQKDLSYFFRKMTEEAQSEYPYQLDALYNYLHLIIHEAMKMQPAYAHKRKIDASAETARLFMELLEKQFPVCSPEEPVKLRTAGDFAQQLSVHVNHLNRVLKSVTGKTTTELIAARLIKEAMVLLRHSDLNISEIAYGLGFEHPSNFHVFFKKHTGIPPLKARDGNA